MRQRKMTTTDLIFFILAFFPVVKMVTLPSILAKYSAEGCIISAIALLLCDLLLTFAVILANSHTKEPLTVVLEKRLGKVLSKIFYGIFAVYFTLKAFLLCCEHSLTLRANLYDTAPSIFTFLPFFIVSLFICIAGIKVLGKCSAILCFLSLGSIIFIYFLTFTQCDWESLLPLFKQPLSNYARAIKHSLLWFNDGIYIFFMTENIVKEKNTGRIVLADAGAALLTAVFIAMFYSVFSFIAPVKLYAATQMSKYGVVNSNILRFDQLAFLIIVFVNIFAMSLPILFASECFKKCTGLKKHNLSPIIINAVLALTIFFLDDAFNIYMSFLNKYLWTFVFFTGYVLPIIVILIICSGVKHEKQTAV